MDEDEYLRVYDLIASWAGLRGVSSMSGLQDCILSTFKAGYITHHEATQFLNAFSVRHLGGPPSTDSAGWLLREMEAFVGKPL